MAKFLVIIIGVIAWIQLSDAQTTEKPEQGNEEWSEIRSSDPNDHILGGFLIHKAWEEVNLKRPNKWRLEGSPIRLEKRMKDNKMWEYRVEHQFKETSCQQIQTQQCPPGTLEQKPSMLCRVTFAQMVGQRRDQVQAMGEPECKAFSL